MRNASHCHKKFIFPKSVRRYYNVCGPLTLVGLLCFSLFMLGVGLKQDQNRFPSFFVAILFGIIHMVYLITWIKNHHIINATYYIDDLYAFNYINRKMPSISVALTSATQNVFQYSFNFGYASLCENYVVFSSNEISGNITNIVDEQSIYKIMQKIWASGSVIIPKANY